MRSQNDRYLLELADEKDSEGIKRVFESGEFSGGISVQFLRGGDPYSSLRNDGDKAVVPVIRDKETGGIAAVGACIMRKAFIGGREGTVGYLTGLKILPEYQKKLSLIPRAYELIYEMTKGEADLYYTTILTDNAQAQRLLEKKRKNMPEYVYQGGYTVYCFKTGGQKNCLPVKKGDTDGLDDFYAVNLPKMNLSCTNRYLFGLGDGDFLTLRNGRGKIVASCAVWDQQSYKQYLLKGYGGVYKILSKLPTELAGYPAFPKEGGFINYASISLLCFDESADERLKKAFLMRVAELSKKYGLLMLGLFENNPICAVLSGIKHIKYQSRLYTVSWDGKTDSRGMRDIKDRSVCLEVGLL